MLYKCIYCGYNTKHRGTFTRHINSKRHQKNKTQALSKQEQIKNKLSCKNSKVSCKNSKVSCKNSKVSCEKIKYNCLVCNYITNNKTNYKNHLTSNNHIILSNLINKYDKQLKEKDNQLKEKNNQLKEKNNQLEEKDNLLKEKDTKIILLESKVELLSEMKNMCKKSKKSVMNIIINNFNNAPDFTAQPINDMSIEDIKRYISMGIPNGVVNMLKDHYVENIPNEQRSLWCLDASRSKYLVRQNNNWKVDLMGKIIKKTMMKPLQTRILDMLNTDEEQLGTMEKIGYLDNINDLMDTNKGNQILKGVSNYFMLKN